MMDITLVFPNSSFLLNESVFPPLGIMYLSAALKRGGYNVQCLDLSLGHKKEEAQADVIGISFTTPQKEQAYQLAKYYRAQGKFVIAGGPHPTHKPHECFKKGSFDLVYRGEADFELVRDMFVIQNDPTSMQNVIVMCKGDYNADDLPQPDRDCLPLHRYKYEIDGEPATVLLTSRGCPFNCSFCAKIVNYCKIQSANRTIEEILHIHKYYGYKAFMIFDDIFIANRQRLRTISKMMCLYDFKFRCFARSNLIDDETCQLMSEMGVVEVGIGVESGSKTILQTNLKGTTPEMNIEAFALLAKYGIRGKAFIIVGLPGETEETIKETCDWIEAAQPYDIDVSILQPLPGSQIFDNPSNFNVKFNYGDSNGWYKGTPGKYDTSLETVGMSSARIIEWRQTIEDCYKRKELLR